MAMAMAMRDSARGLATSSLSAQMMRNLSPEVQRLLSSAEGQLLEDDELEVIADEGEDDETEAEVDEQVEEPDFLSSSPQPKANPRFSPRHLSLSLLRRVVDRVVWVVSCRAVGRVV